MDGDQHPHETHLDVDGQLSQPAIPEEAEVAYADASVSNCSRTVEELCRVEAEGLSTDPKARPALVSFGNFQNQASGHTAGHAEARDHTPTVTPQPSQLLLQSLSRRSSRIQRHSHTTPGHPGSHRRELVASDIVKESNVGYMLPSLHTGSQATDSFRGFRRSRSRSQRTSAARIAADSEAQCQSTGTGVREGGHDHDSSNSSLLALAKPPQVPLPMIAAMRHMHTAARRTVLQSMLSLGPDSSEFTAYTPVFTLTPAHEPVHRLRHTNLTPRDLAQRMELVSAQVVHTKAAPQTLLGVTYALLSDPSSSRAARAVSAVILSGICVSTAAYCYETMPGVPSSAAEAARLEGVEVAMVVLFTVEYVARLVCCPQLREFLLSPMNAIDVLSVLPYYISLLSEQVLGGWAKRGVTRVLRVVRLVRIFRIMKVGVRYRKIRIIGDVVKDTMEILWMLVLLVGLAVLIFSTLVYYVELMELQAEPGDPRVTFRSIPGTFWWSVVTLLTVGYGDVVPGTVAGKIIAALSMVVAVLLMALPVSVIGTTFTQHWVLFRAKERREARTEHAYETLCDLVHHLGAHTQAMADISATVEKCCVRLRVCLHDLYRNEEAIREVYIAGISGGLSPSNAAKQLCGKICRFRKVLTHARRTHLELQSVLQVAEGIMEPSLIAQARSMDEMYLQLTWWFSEGHRVLGNYSTIMDKADATQALLASQPPLRRIRF